MPLLNFGWQKDHSASIKIGVRGLDTALTYGDDQQGEVGRAVRESGIPRSEFFVTTKVPCCPGTEFTGNNTKECGPKQRSNSTADFEHDLKVLGFDYVDLVLLHWPCDDFENTVASYTALEPLVKAGKARAIGISNFNASAIAALASRTTVKPAVNQCGFSIAGHSEKTSHFGRDDDTHMACKEAGLVYSAYSPLGGVALGGTGHVLHDPTVLSIAAAHNVSAARVALRWVVQQGIVAVTKSDNIDHIADDLKVFDFELTGDEMRQLAAVK